MSGWAASLVAYLPVHHLSSNVFLTFYCSFRCTALHVAASLENEHVVATLIERNADLEAFCFESASIKTCRQLLENLISTRQIMQQSGLRNYDGEAAPQALYG